MTEITTDSIDIPKYKISYLQEKIDKLNRKAKKLGCAPMVLSFDNDHEIEYKFDPNTGIRLLNPFVLEMVTAHLSYVIPNIDGYELIACLDIFTGKNGNNEVFVSAVPGKEVPNSYKNVHTIQCDHCKHNRYRTHSILLRHTDTGEYKEVGSTCVKDFFNGNNPAGFMHMASIEFSEIIECLDEEKMDFGRGFRHYNINFVLTLSAAAIAKWGYVSKSKAYDFGGYSTADHVMENIEPSPYLKESNRVAIDQQDIDLANLTLEYFKNLDPGDNDYLINCCKIVSLDYVPLKMLGYACSMILAYKKSVGYEKKAQESSSIHVGSVGERLKNIAVTVIYKREFVNDFGTNVLYTFKDESGNIFKTFYSGYTWACEIDEKISITGTVKKHVEYQGIKETMLNRVRVIVNNI